jgi:hypothetical protein
MELLFALLILAQVLDAHTTILALQKPGNYEANKAIKWLMDRLGVKEALLFVKVASCAIVWFGVLHILGLGYPRLAYGLLGAATAMYSLVAWQNWKLR